MISIPQSRLNPRFSRICTLFFVGLIFIAIGGIQKVTAAGVDAGRLVTDTITSPSLEGNLLGDPATRNITIYLPPSYDKGGSFPVVYLLHGATGDETVFVTEDIPFWKYFPTGTDFPENGFSGMVDDLIAAGQLKELIIVMPDGSNKYAGSMYTNSELIGNYEDYIVEDLVNFIDTHYRTIPSPESRAIAGLSMGGYGAMKLAMKHPDVFGAVASHGGVLSVETFVKPTIAIAIEENPDGLIGPNLELSGVNQERLVTTLFYTVGAAFSPNLENPPFFVDLPFEYPSGAIIDEVLEKWLAHDPLTMLETYGGNLASLRGVYFDAGNQDEFLANFQAEVFHQALTEAGIAHEYQTYDGGHFNRMFERLAISLSFLSDALVAEVEPPPIAGEQEFEITLTNLTKGEPGKGGQVFSPPLFITHTASVKFVEKGTRASEELRILAEDGANGPLAKLAASSKGVGYIVAQDAPLPPGASVTVEIEGSEEGWLLSLATMLVETNDGIAAVDSLPLFDEKGQPRTFTMDLMAYDAGTEANNELKTHIPGPPFGGKERVPETDVIRPHPGIRGNADVGAAFGWTEPVARLTVKPVEEEPEIVAYGYAVLNGDQEVPPVSMEADGTAALELDKDGNLHFNITVTGLSGPMTGAHFHGPASEGKNAPVIFGITETFKGNHAEGEWKELTQEQMGYLKDGLLYLNVHTKANPGGEIRGQVHIGENGIALLSGDAEVPPVKGDAAGTGVFKLMKDGTALWYHLTVTGLSGPMTGAHFHGPASEDENASVIFPITDSFDGEYAEGVWDGLPYAEFRYLLDGMVYVNVHTKANPSGEIRGQVVGLQLPPIVKPPTGALGSDFEVTITNLTKGAPGEGGQVFSPLLLATHDQKVHLFQVGTPASNELRILAEDGNPVPLANLATSLGGVMDVLALDAPLPPGASVTKRIKGSVDARLLSFASMLVETNDGFAGADGLLLFDENGEPRTLTVDLLAFDAGTEENNELKTHVPGPPFGGGQRAPTTDVVRPHPGIRGNADVGAAFGWTEPVARLTVKPVEEEPEIVAYGYATLSGAQEVPVLNIDAAGTAALELDEDGNLHFDITVTGLSGPITGAHFHGPAPEGKNASVIFGITDTFKGNYAEGVWKGLTVEQVNYLMEGQLYLNVHTKANPGGEIRGQVHVGANGVAELEGDSEVPPLTVDAAGTGVFKLVDDGTGLWYQITVTGLSGPITGAHFHGPAPEGTNASVIFGITDTFKGNHAEGVWKGLTDEQRKFLLDGQVYVNVHTTAHPGGEIRGQVEGLQLPPKAEALSVFDMNLAPGLNMISLPLMPPEPYTARKLASQIGATVVIKLDAAMQRFVGFTADSGGEGFPIEGGQGYIVNVPKGGSVKFTGKAWSTPPTPAAPGVDVWTTAWAFVVSGEMQNAETGSNYTVVAKNLRTGAVATDVISRDQGRFASVWADLNRNSVIEAGDSLEITLLDARGNIVAGPFRRNVDITDIRQAYLSLPLMVGDVRPTETKLAQNFPNPFNPETWIPFQLVKSADVTIQIYEQSGRVVRTLSLGTKPAGFYTTRSTAAYWDGRNEAGERVASGVYFYTLQTQDYTATRKMLIAK
ncbi:CHRD domain-containing protein [Candidatus Poribacteria bacterium]|nr:CHRD domain-containing protein [Candidatus Poribacteria bacterium]